MLIDKARFLITSSFLKNGHLPNARRVWTSRSLYLYIYNIHTCYFSSNKKKKKKRERVRVINVETEIERAGMMVCRTKDDINIHI